MSNLEAHLLASERARDVVTEERDKALAQCAIHANGYEDEHRRATLLQERVTHLETERDAVPSIDAIGTISRLNSEGHKLRRSLRHTKARHDELQADVVALKAERSRAMRALLLTVQVMNGYQDDPEMGAEEYVGFAMYQLKERFNDLYHAVGRPEDHPDLFGKEGDGDDQS